MEHNNGIFITDVASSHPSHRRPFGVGAAVSGIISLLAVVGIMFFAGPVIDSHPDKSDVAYGLMLKSRMHGGAPDLNYSAADKYFSPTPSMPTATSLGMKIVSVK